MRSGATSSTLTLLRLQLLLSPPRARRGRASPLGLLPRHHPRAWRLRCGWEPPLQFAVPSYLFPPRPPAALPHPPTPHPLARALLLRAQPPCALLPRALPRRALTCPTVSHAPAPRPPAHPYFEGWRGAGEGRSRGAWARGGLMEGVGRAWVSHGVGAWLARAVRGAGVGRAWGGRGAGWCGAAGGRALGKLRLGAGRTWGWRRAGAGREGLRPAPRRPAPCVPPLRRPAPRRPAPRRAALRRLAPPRPAPCTPPPSTLRPAATPPREHIF